MRTQPLPQSGSAIASLAATTRNRGESSVHDRDPARHVFCDVEGKIV
jgi:hypothetical protein